MKSSKRDARRSSDRRARQPFGLVVVGRKASTFQAVLNAQEQRLQDLATSYELGERADRFVIARSQDSTPMPARVRPVKAPKIVEVACATVKVRKPRKVATKAVSALQEAITKELDVDEVATAVKVRKPRAKKAAPAASE